MNQTNHFERFCTLHTQNKVILTCLNKFCNQNKMICCTCISNHAGHIDNLIDNKIFEGKIQQVYQGQENIIKQLNFIIDSIILKFNLLKQGIQEKYCVTTDNTNLFNSEEYCEYITCIIQFEEQQEYILKNIQEGCVDFDNRIQQCVQLLNVDNLKYAQKILDNTKKENDLFQKGKQYYDVNDYSNAPILFKQALQINQNNINTLSYLGNSLRFLNKHQESIEYYDKAIQIDFQEFESLYGIGRCLEQLKQYQEAIDYFDRAIQVDPKNKLSLYYKGACLFELKQFEDALQCFDLAKSIDPQFLACYYFKGECLRKSGKLVEAIKEQEKAILIDPTFEHAQILKFDCLIEMDKFKEAHEFINTIININPNSQAAKTCSEIMIQFLSEQQQNMQQVQENEK